MAPQTDGRSLPDTYFLLVKQFPLTHIRDDDHLAAASAVIDRLLQHEIDEGEQEYLNVLTDRVEAYEDAHLPIRDASEADVLRELMNVHGLTQPKLAKAVGIAQSTISAVLNGTRALTKNQIIKLSKFFGVGPGAFMPG
jgi:HTH-type transcriptional regulator/antitoxin HigA